MFHEVVVHNITHNNIMNETGVNKHSVEAFKVKPDTN